MSVVIFNVRDAVLSSIESLIKRRETMDSASCKTSSAHLLIAIFLLSNSISFCNGILKEDANISADESLWHPEVEIPQGRVRGVNQTSYRNRQFFSFKGIPFAEPPVGNLRFRSPVPAGRWNGTLDATNDTSDCPQFEMGVLLGNEDCLYLNVYTPRLPATDNSTLLPVMVFIFGGVFKAGSNGGWRWSPEFILDKDVILVVPNYRSGALGYLTTGDEVSPGNYGMKDLVQALKWNRDNIQYFGGDPDRVTIFGGSSGAITVHLLTLSNLTNGLFHRYITQSGSATSLEVQRPRSVLMNYTIRLGQHFGCPTNTSSEVVDCLRGIPALDIVDANSIFLIWNSSPNVVWGPTDEPDLEGAFITDLPANLIASGKIRDIPRLACVARDEGLVVGATVWNKPDLFQDFLDKIDNVLPFLIGYYALAGNSTAVTSRLKSYYLNDLTADRSALLANFTQLTGDGLFTYPTYSGLRKHLTYAKSPQYLSVFEFHTNFSYSYKFSGGSTTNMGVSHADELMYLLPGPKDISGPEDLEFGENDWQMVDTMVQLWTSFAINGTPSLSGQNGTIWEPFTSSSDNYLQIGNGPDPGVEMKRGFYPGRMRFWEELEAARLWN